jgi:hypothetical protein
VQTDCVVVEFDGVKSERDVALATGASRAVEVVVGEDRPTISLVVVAEAMFIDTRDWS